MTMTLAEKVADFLAQPRIAVAGVSATRELTGNGIYRKLKTAGHQVTAILPSTDSFEGDPCYPDLGAIPGGVDGVVIVTNPTVTLEVVRQAVAAGVPRVWMHQSVTSQGTSVSPEAVELCKENGIMVIAGACPMMYCTPVDFAHRCMRWIAGATGGLPK
jgi:predicted CoA-binding protein